MALFVSGALEKRIEGAEQRFFVATRKQTRFAKASSEPSIGSRRRDGGWRRRAFEPEQHVRRDTKTHGERHHLLRAQRHRASLVGRDDGLSDTQE